MRWILGFAAALLVAGCTASSGLPQPEAITADPDRWGNPCMQASLVDGLSTEEPGELRAIFRCLNLNGGFDEAAHIVEVMETSGTRTGRIASLEVADVLNAVVADPDVVGWLTQATHLLQEQDVFLLHVIHTIAEWSYGRPWYEVEAAFVGGGGELLLPEAVEGGMIQPLVSIGSTLSGALLDTGRIDLLAAMLGDLAVMPELAETLDTWAYLVAEQEADVFGHLAEDFGGYFQASITATGEDTIVAAVEQLVTPNEALGDATPLEAVLPQVDAILDDPVVIPRLVDAVGELYLDETLAPLPEQLKSLLVVDAYGNPIVPGQPDRVSAFEALLMLLEEADAPVSCGLLEVDNLSVWILETVAGFDADTVETSILLTEGLVETLLVLGQVACSGIHPDLAEHAPALVPLASSGALHTLIPVLAALRVPFDSDHNRIPEVVTILATLQRGGMSGPIAAHGVEVIDVPGIGNALVVVGAYVAPADPKVDGDIYTLLRIVDFLVSPRTDADYSTSPVGFGTRPIRRTVVAHRDELSDWLQRWAVLLAADGSESNTFAYHVAPLLDIDPELGLLATAGRFLGDPEVLEPLLRVLDCDAVAVALGASSTPDGEPAVLGMLGRMSADGSLEALLTLLTWVAETLDAIGLLPD